jgi:hypothetical protein
MYVTPTGTVGTGTNFDSVSERQDDKMIKGVKHRHSVEHFLLFRSLSLINTMDGPSRTARSKHSAARRSVSHKVLYSAVSISTRIWRHASSERCFWHQAASCLMNRSAAATASRYLTTHNITYQWQKRPYRILRTCHGVVDKAVIGFAHRQDPLFFIVVVGRRHDE